MKTILVFVTSLDGKITKWCDPSDRAWSSKGDQDYFDRIWKENKLMVMGSNTYNADPLKPSSNRLLVVMTQNPSKYKSKEIQTQLEFSDETPEIIVARFKAINFKQMLIVGGARIATSFLKDQLIDELWLTIEPKIFGLGNNFVIAEKLDISLTLISCEKINEQGTMIAKYLVVKDKKSK